MVALLTFFFACTAYARQTRLVPEGRGHIYQPNNEEGVL